MTLLRLICYSTLIVIICSFTAFAQSKSVNPAVKTSQANANTKVETSKNKKQSIDFEDELVEGSAQKPEFLYMFQKKNINYKRLIKLRENFIPEMRRSSEDIQRLRGGR